MSGDIDCPFYVIDLGIELCDNTTGNYCDYCPDKYPRDEEDSFDELADENNCPRCGSDRLIFTDEGISCAVCGYEFY